jgi:hypothetical protein
VLPQNKGIRMIEWVQMLWQTLFLLDYMGRRESELLYYAGFDVLTAVAMENSTFWNYSTQPYRMSECKEKQTLQVVCQNKSHLYQHSK